MSPGDQGLILLTGATGYVGGRLLPRLVAEGRRVRCLARRPAELSASVPPGVEVAEGDLLLPGSLDAALAGVDSAFYLVHSMGLAKGFEESDRRAALAFAEAARRAGVRRIVYLGGLARDDESLSPHLRSRHEVGRILRESGVPVAELRASIVIGPGSLSYELVRALVEKLPVLVAPKWVRMKAQPIAIDDLLDCLVAALDMELRESEVLEIGGADVVSYGDLMMEHARQRGLRRLMVPVPLLTPTLSSYWLGLVTPVYARVGRKLIDSVRHESIVRRPGAMERLGVRPMGVAEAMSRALRAAAGAESPTKWSDARSSAGASAAAAVAGLGPPLQDVQERDVAVPPEIAFRPIMRIGGDVGWYHVNWLWRMRGFIDLLAGGVGLRRGRRDPERLRVGDALDFWRVEAIEPGRRLLLRAEMRVPGRARLELAVEPRPGGGSRIRQAATFEPAGFPGRLYWYGILPLHAIVFRGMIAALAREAIREAAREAARAGR